MPPRYRRRALVDACCYVVRTGCAWRMLPAEFPPWQNVYRTFRRWLTAGKKVKGRKRNLIVDTLGLLLAVSVTAASVQDRDAAHVPVAEAMGKYPQIETLFVDNGYAGQCAAILRNDHELNVDVVRQRKNQHNFLEGSANVSPWLALLLPRSDFAHG